MNRKERRAAQKRGGPTLSPMAQTLAAAFRTHQAGHRSDAERLYRDVLAVEPRNAPALHLLGALLHQSGRTDEAISLIQQAIAIEPRNPDYHYNLGSILQSAGRMPEAISQLEKAIAAKPGYAEAHFELGAAFARENRFEDAQNSFRQVLKLQPGNTDAMHNLGRVLRAANRTDEAVAIWERAVTAQPQLAMSHLNIGIARREQNRLEEAEASLRNALAVNENYPQALHELALVSMLRDRPEQALPLVVKALASGETAVTRALFVECILAIREFRPEASLRDLIRRALDEAWTRPNLIAPLCASILNAHPVIGAAIARVAAQWKDASASPDLPDLSDVEMEAAAQEGFFKAYLEATPNCEIDIERFLTALRAKLLDRARSGATVSESMVGLCTSLARQCFINEYVFSESETESNRVRQLTATIANAIRNDGAISDLQIASLATYGPLHNIENAQTLLKRSWPSSITALLRQQIEEPLQELSLAAGIPALTAIDSTASAEVPQQSERNPYPRWMKLTSTLQPLALEDLLKWRLSRSDIPPLGLASSPEILIAGCGTGQQALEAAMSYRDARILAIDVSATSLAFARRLARDAVLDRLEFAQADIMKLSSLGRSFDVIESTGVLHHLDDPFAGWSILLSLLRPGGLMRIGLYSEIARRQIGAAQAIAKQGNYQSDAEGIRLFRQNLLRLPRDREPLKTTLNAADFYSTSACRDLFFHAHEHRMTLPAIQSFLEANKLELLGFETTNEIRRAFRKRFPGPRADTDLANWHAFEQDNPDTFQSMYNFWVRKSAANRR